MINNHIELAIVKGVFRAPGDPNSAEQEVVPLNLLDDSGLALDVDGWSPAIAALKSGGVWADSAASDGRQLVSSAVGNVTEQMRLTMGNTDLLQRYATLTRLNRLAQDARSFHATDWQIEPVYLTWWAAVAQVPQHALIYNIEIAQASDIFDVTSPWEVTLTIEREPAWRILVPPGGNPREWHYWTKGWTRGVEYNYEDLSLYEGTDHFAYQALDNCCEWEQPDYDTAIGVSYVDIPATDIPGDAPALALITHERLIASGYPTWELFIAKTTAPTTGITHDSPSETRTLTGSLNAGDATSVGTGGSKVSGNGCISNGSNVTRYFVEFSWGASAFAKTMILQWGDQSFFPLDLTMLHGRFMCLLRCALESGSAGDVKLSLKFIENGNSGQSEIELEQVSDIPIRTGNTVYFCFLGTIKLPFENRLAVSMDGLGKEVSASNLHIELYAQKVSTSARVLNVFDLILIPIEEGVIHALPKYNSNNLSDDEHTIVIFDNTGYLAYGQDGQVVKKYAIETSIRDEIPLSTESRGTPVMLTPGVNNRLYFWQAEHNATFLSAPISQPRADGDIVRINIVPRCYGIADVSR